MIDDVLESRLYRWSRLHRGGGHWHVWTSETHHGAVTIRLTRDVRWWSPRDLARFPLHWLWRRRYW